VAAFPDSRRRRGVRGVPSAGGARWGPTASAFSPDIRESLPPATTVVPVHHEWASPSGCGATGSRSDITAERFFRHAIASWQDRGHVLPVTRPGQGHQTLAPPSPPPGTATPRTGAAQRIELLAADPDGRRWRVVRLLVGYPAQQPLRVEPPAGTLEQGPGLGEERRLEGRGVLPGSRAPEPRREGETDPARHDPVRKATGCEEADVLPGLGVSTAHPRQVLPRRMRARRWRGGARSRPDDTPGWRSPSVPRHSAPPGGTAPRGRGWSRVSR